MEARSYPKLALTSKAITLQSDGLYSFDRLGFLVPHEALRREFQRGRKVLDVMNSSSFPWHAYVFQEWLDDFLIPILQAHHYIEDHIVFTFYFELGVISPDRQSEDHISLIGRMNKLQSLTRKLVHIVKAAEIDQDGVEGHQKDIQAAESLVKKEFIDMIIHFEQHFQEEEEYWPEILKKYGHANWLKVEQMIYRYTLSFGDSNKGDSYRNYLCSICRSMGIVIAKAELPADEVPWAGQGLQERYIKTRPWMIRVIKIKTWNRRYLGYLNLLEEGFGQKEPKKLYPQAGKYVAKYPKPFVPMVLLIVLATIFCLSTLPVFSAVANPWRNAKYLHIKVVNYDSGIVGSSFLNFLHNVADSSNRIATFVYESPKDSYATYEKRVLDGEAWAVIAVHANATNNLMQAFDNGCANAADYVPSSAISFAWDEGRNSAVAASYIGGFIRSIIPRFIDFFATQYLQTVSSTTFTDCVAGGYSRLFVSPIGFVENNLTPVAISAVVTGVGLTVGNILMAVFGSMYILNGTYGGTVALAEDYSPRGKVFLRAITMAVIGMALSACYATAMVGLTKDGSSDHLYTGYQWAQVFAVQWIHVMIWSFGMGSVMEGFGPGLIPFMFGILLNYNILGGWNLDLADQGFKKFFQIFPFHWVIYILRYSFYKSQGYHRGISAGILVAYFLVFVSLYLYLGIRNETRNHASRQIVLEEEVAVTHSGKGGHEHKTKDVQMTSSGHVVYHVVKDKEEVGQEQDEENRLAVATHRSEDNSGRV